MERTLPWQEAAWAEHVAFLVPDTGWASPQRNENVEENTKLVFLFDWQASTQCDPYTQHGLGGMNYSHWLFLAEKISDIFSFIFFNITFKKRKNH